MQTMTTSTSRKPYRISGVSEPCLPKPRKQGLASLLLKTLALFQEVADYLAGDGKDPILCATYRYLHANCLLLSERARSAFKEAELSASVNPFAGLILHRFSSLLRKREPSAKEQKIPFSELDNLCELWNTLAEREEKRTHIAEALDVDATNRWEALVAFLEDCVGSLDDPSTYTADEGFRPKISREPPCEVYIAARTMVHVLANCSTCDCDPCHAYTARFRLATYRQIPDGEDRHTFQLLLSSDKQVWQETAIHSALPKTKSKVRIIAEERPNRRGRGRSHRMAVRRLCDHLGNRSSLYCLNLEIEDGKLWKSRSSDLELNLGASHISLESIIATHPTTLSEKVKRVLAVLVGHCFLYLHETAWLIPRYFNSSHIIFFGRPSLLPLMPFIHMQIDPAPEWPKCASAPEGPDKSIDPDDLPLHSHPGLVMLAIILMEVYLAKPILDLAELTTSTSTRLEAMDDNTIHRIATKAFQRYKSEFMDNYRIAIATCLDPDIGYDTEDNEIEGEEFKALVYNEIVQRLEEELEQGFGESIPINNLDQAAPTLNLDRWGTMNLTVEGKTRSPESEVYLHVDSIFPAPSYTTKSNNTGHRAERHETVSGGKVSESALSAATLSQRLTHQDYVVGWICALAEEMAAARAMLDEEHPGLSQNLKVDNNNYILGRMGTHNVVLACLPSGVTGTTSAAVVANRMRSTFHNIRLGLMVGIGGAAPNEIDDIRLGDVVVGIPHGGCSGVIQYDFGKTMEEGKLMITSSLNRAPDVLLTAVSNLRSEHFLLGHKLEVYLKTMVERYPPLKRDFTHPGAENDILYRSDYVHEKKVRMCTSCDQTKAISRKARDSAEPVIHYGIIASGNQVMKDATTRDRLKQDLGILCFEMEAAGLVDDFPCLVIRGISDYADSHKNDMWRYYAAATAAAYAKELLSSIQQVESPSKA
ncbi:hypothetical protein BJX64DRAFT_298119 [Aspergillus heterothallicus]